MKSLPFYLLLITCTFLHSASAQDISQEPSRFSLGLQSSNIVWGASGQYFLSETLTPQITVGFSANLTALSGRLMYRFERNKTHDLYGYGGVSYWSYSFNNSLIDDESAVGFGGGGGVEFSWGSLLGLEDFPPLYGNLEAGLTLASFDTYAGFSSFTLGGGLHYRF